MFSYIYLQPVPILTLSWLVSVKLVTVNSNIFNEQFTHLVKQQFHSQIVWVQWNNRKEWRVKMSPVLVYKLFLFPISLLFETFISKELLNQMFVQLKFWHALVWFFIKDIFFVCFLGDFSFSLKRYFCQSMLQNSTLAYLVIFASAQNLCLYVQN